MPKAIRRDFDMVIEANGSILAGFNGGMHTS